MLALGYAGAQCGTRFIATTECTAHADYKHAILDAGEDDIVPTERVTGVPLAVIRTPFIERMGTKAGPIGRWMLTGRRTKHWIRALVLAALGVPAARGFDEGRDVGGLLAGRQERRDDHVRPAGGGDRAGVRGGAR